MLHRFPHIIGCFIFLYSCSFSSSLRKDEEAKIIVQDGKFYVTTRISELNPLLCFLDTGAFGSEFKEDLLKDSVPAGHQSTMGVFGQKHRVRLVNIPSVSVGPFMKTPYQAAIQEIPDLTYNCTIGLDIFGKSQFKLDFKSLELSRIPELKKGNELEPSNLFMTLNVEFSNKRHKAAFDTGANFTAFDQALIKKNPEDFVFIQRIESGRDSTGLKQSVDLYSIRSLKIGGIAFNDVLAVAVDFSRIRARHNEFPDFVIGFNLMENRVWSFDLKNLLWTVE